MYAYVHAVEGIARAGPSAGEGGGFFLFSGDAYGDVLTVGEFVVGGVEAVPACAGEVDFGPGVGGAVLAGGHLDVAGDEAGAEAPVAGGFHHEDGIVAAGAGAEGEGFVGELDAGVVALGVFEGFVDVGVEVGKEVEGVDDLAGAVEGEQPVVDGRAVVGVAGEAVGDEGDLLIGRILEGEGAGGRVYQAFDGAVGAKLDVYFGVEQQAGGWLGEVDEGDGVALDVSQPPDGGGRFELDGGGDDGEVVALAGAHHGAVLAEGDGDGVVVLGVVDDADAFHGWGG